MNILVTGGAGFIGSHTAVALHEAGFTPVIIDNFTNSAPSALDGLEKILGFRPAFYENNCDDAALLRHIFEKEQIGGVIHFAAYKAVGESMAHPLKYYRNNLGSLLTLLEVMLEKQVPNLIFSSSCTVYGQPDQLPVTEDSPVKPAESVYGNTKQICEEILRDTIAAKNPLKITSLRYFNPIGAHPSALIGELPLGVPSNLVPFVTQTAAGIRNSLTVFGGDYPTPDGTCIRDYIHVMDLAEAHVAALQQLVKTNDSSFYEVYNVGTGNGNSVLEVIHAFDAISGQEKLPFVIGARRPGDVVAVYADAQKVTAGLGWNAKRSLEEALRDAWNWQKTLRQA
ncbi:MAG: UDP-glucose 4-epimerase GalE [Bacteroidetes bacterium]|nr:UDP-glucose 4-epimerase GalE [Bacteroidota bacterium]